MNVAQDFKPQTVVLLGPTQVELAASKVRNAPVGAGLEVVIRPVAKQRGLDANAYYWVRLGEIADQAWFSGKQYDRDTWHEYAKRNILPDLVTIKGGEVVSKWIESPDGTLHVISTTVLEKKCFADYVTALEAFGAGLGVRFSVKGERYEK